MIPSVGTRPVIALVALVLTVGSAAAQPPVAKPTQPAVALVLEVRGTTDPPLKPFREIRAGDIIRLGDGARLVVLDYRARGGQCHTVTLEGGVVTFKPQGDPVVEGGVLSTRHTKCPQRLPVTQAAGAIVQRSGFARLPVKPAFMIGGSRGGDVAMVRVRSEDGKRVLEARVSEQRFSWPANRPELALNQRYTLEFLARKGATVLGTREFFTSAGDADTPTVIIID